MMKEFSWELLQGEDSEAWGKAPGRLGGQREYGSVAWELVAGQFRRQVQEGEDVLLPLIAYYRIDRRWSRHLKAGWDTPGTRFEGYEGCLDPASNVGLLMGWLKTQEATALQEKTADNVLIAVKRAIANCMENWGEVFYRFKENDLIATSADK